ncbi:DUF6891 domain-containing protein [Gordonia hankookensis]|uniref:DUF6891 domain-containing protein n=1 Tax=Gordonia hankookensis TaxID=589403 RepID=A0ABR7W736_9ACTN|nr:hypothetical protein [Gordonia hankookensis]MBD1318637.1 hypothetical protein [Gordonia hankookensis]
MQGAHLADLRDLVSSRLIPGFTGLVEIEADARDWAEDAGESPDDAVGEVRRLWDDRAQAQRQWTDTGDYARLRAAFDDLDADGVLARMNFSCCSRCATQEIDSERTPDPDRDDWYKFREWAYVFFHEQDAERLADDDAVLYLGYSAFRPHPTLPESLLDAMSAGDTDAEDVAYERTETLLGEQIVETLRRHGLDVAWSGSRHDRIGINVTQWRKPLPR